MVSIDMLHIKRYYRHTIVQLLTAFNQVEFNVGVEYYRVSYHLVDSIE
jgi:hypothetical protein